MPADNPHGRRRAAPNAHNRRGSRRLAKQRSRRPEPDSQARLGESADRPAAAAGTGRRALSPATDTSATTRTLPVSEPATRERGSHEPGSGDPAAGPHTRTVRPAGALTPTRVLWLLALAGCTLALLAARVLDRDARWVAAVAAVTGVLLAIGLATRSGGRPVLSGLLAAALGGAAVVTESEIVLGGAAAGTAVVAATLAVLATTPAATIVRTVQEVLLATLIGGIGSLAVVGYGVPLDAQRFKYVVLALSLGAAIALVYRLGAGLHGLGTRGYVVAGAALLVLAVALAYTEALARWGSAGMIDNVNDLRLWVRNTAGAVPHPIEVLLGVPALAWGVFMRARRRQGWWVCAFGAAMTAPVTTRLLDHGVSGRVEALSAAYSLILGLLVGIVVIRIEQAFTGSRGHRSRRAEEAAAVRPEPSRFSALH